MGRVVSKEYGQELGILKHFPFQGVARVIKEAGVSADANGLKIVKAGTPYPADDNTCEGYLLHDVDVTNGDAVGTVVYVGDVDESKLLANGITVSAQAKSATPRVTFFA